MAWSSGSSSCSPAEDISSSQRHGGSKRRSITEMSQSARMTPQSQRDRGLGMPWMQSHGLFAVDVQPGDVDEARQFCLLPTPELGEKPQMPPGSPELHSPRSMQRRFSDLVHRASLGERSPSSGRSPSDVPGTPDTKPRRRSSLASLLDSTPEAISSVSPMHEGFPMSETTPTFESGILSGQVATCSSGAPLRIPFICRLDERLSKARNRGVTDLVSTTVSTESAMTQMVQHESFVGNSGLFRGPSCAIFEDATAPRRVVDLKKYVRPKHGLEKKQKLGSAKSRSKYLFGENPSDTFTQERPQGFKENAKMLNTLSGNAEQKKQAIVRGNGNLKALAKQAKIEAMVKTSAARVVAKVEARRLV